MHQPSPEDKRRALRARLSAPGAVTAPGVFDMISARMADRAGFDLIYMTGYGVAASHLGLPDAGLASYSEMRDRAATIAAGTVTPLIADGDTGFGGLLNVDHTVRGYEAAGVCGIQLEDQEFPKKCGHTPGRRVIPAEDMVAKIRVAVEARNSADFLIVARTDSLASLGVDEALRRAEMFDAAGADILFVESPETLEQMERIGKVTDKPLVANMVEGGSTPILPPAELAAMGFKLVLHPATAFLAMARALEDAYAALRTEGHSTGLNGQLYDFDDFSRLMGFERVWEFDRRHAG